MSRFSQNIVYSWIGFIFLPFVMFLYALKNFFNKNNQRIILAFSFLYGYSVYLSSGDITHYEQGYYEVLAYTWNDYIYLLTNFMSPEKELYYSLNVVTSKPDIFALSVSFIVSRFTENPRWFWAVISLIYTFLTINFINIISNETNWIKGLFSQRIFFTGLVLIVPFYVGVTGVRFWPALFLFTAYAVKFAHYKQLKYLALAALSILIHYSFILPVVLLLVSIIIPKNRFVYLILVVVSSFIFVSSTVATSLRTINQISSNFEETSIDDSITLYTNEDNLNQRRTLTSQANWYVRYKNDFILYFFIILGILDVLGVFKFKETPFLKNTYPLLVIFLVVTLLTIDLGSISRFNFVFYLLVLSRYMVLSGIQPFNFKLKVTSFIFLPILTLYVIVSFRAGFYTVDPLLIVNNAVTTFFFHSDVSLSEFLIGH